MKQKITKCPSPAYKPYTPDLATRLAQARAREFQPELTTLASNVPAYIKGEGWK